MALLPFGGVPPKTNVAGTGISVTNAGSTSTIALSSALPSQYIGNITFSSANTPWTNSNTSWSNFSAISSVTTNIVGTAITAPSTFIPGFTLSGSAGTYVIVINGGVYIGGSALGNGIGMRVSDGTNNSSVANLNSGGTQEIGAGSYMLSIVEATSFSGLTFQLQSISVVGTETLYAQATQSFGNPFTIAFDVFYYPLAGLGGTGITRSVNAISSPTTAGSVAQTDYVYLVSGTTTLTLPTAVSNSNLYTVKNTGVNTVSIATTSAQTIDGSASPITLPVSNTSLDLVSDGANWRIV